MKEPTDSWDRTNRWPDHLTFNLDGTGLYTYENTMLITNSTMKDRILVRD